MQKQKQMFIKQNCETLTRVTFGMKSGTDKSTHIY